MTILLAPLDLQIDKLQSFYDAVSDAGLPVSVAEEILNNYLYGSPSKRCRERMDGAFRGALIYPFSNQGLSHRGGDIQSQYGRRFILPISCTDYEINNDICPEQPENACTQIDENIPLPVPNSDIEKEGCEDLLGQFALDLMGYVPPTSAIKPIEPFDLSDSDPINPIMKGEVTKKMCSLKDYSFTIGD